jgi:hypothetical protein
MLCMLPLSLLYALYALGVMILCLVDACGFFLLFEAKTIRGDE